jgi:uncharacterized membrane protein YfcA
MITDIMPFLILGAAAGGFINGLSGTGTALFALGFYLVVLPPMQSVAIVALMAFIVGIQGLWIVRAEILARPKRLARFVVPGLLGVPIGLTLLDMIDGGTLRIGIATLLIIYGGYFGFRTSLTAFERNTPWLDGMFGLTGGILGGAASVSGAIPSMWLSMRPWPKAETRAVLQPYNVAVLSTTIILLAFKGAYNKEALQALAITVPVGLIAAQVGIAAFKRLNDNTFRRLLIILTLLMGLGILASELF